MKTVEAEKIVSRVLTERVLSLAEAQNEIRQATGRRPDRATICRWINVGSAGIKLDAVRVGSRFITSAEALSRFFTARTAKGD